MKCTAKIVNAHGSPYSCTADARWWWREGAGWNWRPRCGRHALMPGNTNREREPISEAPPPMVRTEQSE